MTHTVDLTEQITGTYWHASAVLKVHLDAIVTAPLEELRFDIGGGAVTRRVQAEVGPLISGHASLRVPLHWKAADHPNLFPVMESELRISDVDGDHIQLHLVGEYCAPLGAVGAFADALAGRRVAEKSLRNFLTEVAFRLRHELAEHTEGWLSGDDDAREGHQELRRTR